MASRLLPQRKLRALSFVSSEQRRLAVRREIARVVLISRNSHCGAIFIRSLGGIHRRANVVDIEIRADFSLSFNNARRIFTIEQIYRRRDEIGCSRSEKLHILVVVKFGETVANELPRYLPVRSRE